MLPNASRARAGFRAGMLLGMAAGVTLLCAAVAAAVDAPVVPASGPSRLDPELKGQVLIEELNCAACHPSEAIWRRARSRRRDSPRSAPG